MTHETLKGHPWRIRFADAGGSIHDPETRMRSYALRDKAMAVGGELAYRFHRTLYVYNLETGARVEIRASGQIRGDVQ